MQNINDQKILRIEKEELREEIRKLKIQNFEGNKSYYLHLSLNMYEKVIGFKLYTESDKIAIYASKISSYEIQTDEIINHALSNGKMVYLPRCITSTKNLEFIRIEDLQKDTEIATFSIREPKSHLLKIEHAKLFNDIKLLFIPGMAFDKFGNRLGYGTGYFDNFINDIKKTNKKLIVIGLAFDFQFFHKEIPHNSNDAKVGYIITPSEILKIPKNNT